MAKDVVFRVWLDCNRRVKGAPDLFVDVPVPDCGDARKNEKLALNILRGQIRYGTPRVVQHEAPAAAPLPVGASSRLGASRRD